VAVSLQISEELKAQIKAIAEAENRTPHWIMHNAIRQFVETYEGSGGSGETRAPTITPETAEIINQAVEQRMTSQWADFIEYLDKRLDATAETRLPPGESIFDSWPHDVPEDAPIRRVEKALVEKVRKIKRTTGAKPKPA
jgi:hypothetical protein